MLIEFWVSNYRSFKARQVLSMVASHAKEHRETHTFDAGIPGFERILASAAVYGANASGKTNLLRSLQYMQAVVLNSAAFSPTLPLDYTPFKFDMLTQIEPSEFKITFIEGETRYEYCFSLDATRIYREQLVEFHTNHPRVLFERSYNKKSQGYDWKFSKAFRGNRVLWRNATRPNALFLSTAIQLNNTQLLPVFSWFQKRLVTVLDARQMNLVLTLRLLDDPNGKERLLPFIREADPGIADVKVRAEPWNPNLAFVQGVLPLIYQDSPTSPPKVANITFSHLSKGSSEAASLDIGDESSGTQVLFRTAGAWLNVLLNGEVLLVDEVDASLHPLLIQFLISRFHSELTNPQRAQIVFTTHNTFLLSQEIFRRDQIWFVEKDTDNASKLYPLSDFSPRNDEVIERWYMRGRYGALPIVGNASL
jgi:AAA15 family ATPase/GTPase